MKTILLVEDNKFLRVATERILTKAGYQVICAGDGDEALVPAGSSLPDLIVLDMRLPKLSGPEVLRSLKKNDLTAHPCGGSFRFVPEQRPKTGAAGRCRCLHREVLLLENPPRRLLEAIMTALPRLAVP
jgi:CheY-like chemotaxis protein